jgi:hypothetical protein
VNVNVLGYADVRTRFAMLVVIYAIEFDNRANFSEVAVLWMHDAHFFANFELRRVSVRVHGRTSFW